MKIVYLILISLFFSYTASYTQELKKKKNRQGKYIEEYFVLKENKDIKHGQYLKFKLNLLNNKILIEIGKYDHNEKTETWYSFYSQGSLKAFGNFNENKKDGFWEEYYSNGSENIFSPFTGDQYNFHINDDGSLTISKENLKISAKGNFQSGSKNGAWNYYAKQGYLIHKFNHTTGSIIEKGLSNSPDYSCPFLGGMPRFNVIYSDTRSEVLFGVGLPEITSKVLVKLKLEYNSCTFDLVEKMGDPDFANQVLEILSKIPKDWSASVLDENYDEVYFTAEYIKEENNRFLIRFDTK